MQDVGSGGNLTREDRARSLADFGVQKLRSLATGLCVSEPVEELERQFRELVEPWGHLPRSTAYWPSDITDDGSPFEFSVAFAEDAAPDLRLLVEAMTPTAKPTLRARWEAAWDLTRRLGRQRPGMDCSRLHQIADLFEPSGDGEALFAMWHAVSLRDGSAAVPKVYMNPQISGSASAPTLVKQALLRLGCRQAWTDLSARLENGSRSHKLVYFSLDLAAGDTARIKIYVAHPGATVADLEQSFAGSRDYRPGDVTHWCRSVLGGHGPYRERPVLSCFAYTLPDEPPTGTLHLPVRSYLSNDEVAARRITEFLPVEFVGTYRNTLTRFAGRELVEGRGLQTYASFRRQSGRQRLTVYLSPETYAVNPGATAIRPHSIVDKRPAAEALAGGYAPLT